MPIADDIRAAFERDDPKPVSKAKLLVWMQSPDIETKAAPYDVLTTPNLYARIQPPLTFAERCGAIFAYLCQCIVENPQTESAHSRYLAGYELARWLIFWWHGGKLPRGVLVTIKKQLAEAYRSGDDGVRDGLLNGPLEHAFEDDGLAEFFADWRLNPILKDVYEDALLWRSTGDQAFAAADAALAEWADLHDLRLSKEGGGSPRRYFDVSANPEETFQISIEPPLGAEIFVDFRARALDRFLVHFRSVNASDGAKLNQSRTVHLGELKLALEQALAQIEEWKSRPRK